MRRFKIIVSICEKNDMGLNGILPWCKIDTKKFLRKKTLGNKSFVDGSFGNKSFVDGSFNNGSFGNKPFVDGSFGDGYNAIIMGRLTFENLIKNDVDIFKSKKTIVLTKQPQNGCLNEGIHFLPTIEAALNETRNNNDVFIIGGDVLYKSIIDKYMYLCDEVLIYISNKQHKCNSFFPYEKILKYSKSCIIQNKFHSQLGSYILEEHKINVIHCEYQYLNLLSKIIKTGERRYFQGHNDTLGIFGETMKFDLRQGFPLVTTKKTWFEGIKRELLFFLSGKTDTKILDRTLSDWKSQKDCVEKQYINIWKDKTRIEYLRNNNLEYDEGDMGPGYSFQWRHCGADYQGCNEDYTEKGIDQIKNVINSIRNNPFSRKHIVSSWDVVNIDNMVLPPCNSFFQFYVGCEDNINRPSDLIICGLNDLNKDTKQQSLPKYLDCILHQRSSDMFLSVPFNIASYSLLISIIGKLTGLIPRYFNHNLGDCHIYMKHIRQTQEQILRTPYPLCKLKFMRDFKCIDDIKTDDIFIEDYKSHPIIKLN